MNQPKRTRAVSSEYDRLANRYEVRWSKYVRASTEHTLRHLRLKRGVRVLDVGCGTGLLLNELTRSVPGLHAAGIDLSHEMIKVARRRLPVETLLLAGDAENLPFGANRFEVVVSASSLHYWRRPGQVLGEIARVLTERGQFVVTDWCDDFLACRVCDRILRVVNRAHHRIYGSGECEAMLRATGFRVQTLDRYKVNWLWGLMTASAPLNKSGT